jgi:hypothetical protein
MAASVSCVLRWFWDVRLATLHTNAKAAMLFIISRNLTIFVSAMMDSLSTINPVNFAPPSFWDA